MPPAPQAPADPDVALRKHAAVAAELLIGAAKRAEPDVTKALQELSKQLKGELAGLEHRLKTTQSLTRKLLDRARTRVKQDGVDPELAIKDEASKANDVLRYTLVLDEKSYWANEERLRAAMKARGYPQSELPWDAWLGRAYKGLTIRFTTAEHQVFEVQVHTKASFGIKMSTHEAYEEFRDPNTSPERRKALEEYMAGKWVGTSVPVKPAQGKGKK